MYKIVRNGRKLKGIFDSYESARSEARKRLRKQGVKGPNRNPALFSGLFSIIKVG